LGIKKRIEKLETRQVQAEIHYSQIVEVDCGENGYPVDEKNAEILRKAEAAHVGKKGIWAVCICRAGVLGLDQKIQMAAQSPTLDIHTEPT
jgi:hypothetical protein